MSLRFVFALPFLLNACRPETPEDEADDDTAPVDADGDGASAEVDCDDADATSFPGGDEVCDDADNDCDGEVDEGLLSTFYADADGDGYGDEGVVTQACTLPVAHTTDSADCDDADDTVNPAAAERWYDEVDQNCDDASDFDQDGDGYDSSAHGGTDCDDLDAASYADEGSCRCLQGWWPFDDGTGSVASDRSGNGYDGVLEGDATWTTGAVGGAVQLDGEGDFVDMGDILDLSLPVTFAAWVWVESDNFIFLATDDADTHYSGFWLQVHPDGRFWASFGDGTGLGEDDRRSVRTNADVARGAWQHLAVVFRGGVDADLYVDGALAASAYDGSGGSMVSSSRPFRVGRFDYGGEHVDAQGAIDDLRVYQCGLDEDEIAAIAAR